MKTTKLYVFLLTLTLICFASYGASGQSAAITLRPQYVDISNPLSQGAVLVTLSGYSSNDARFRLFDAIEQYNCWDVVSATYITSNLYENSPLVLGDPTGLTSFWILYQRGLHNSTDISYRDRLGPGYTNAYQTVALPAATAISSSSTISGEFVGVVGHDLTSKYVVLAYNQSNLISATSTDIGTGQFTIVYPTGILIDKVEIRTIDNQLLAYAGAPKSVNNNLGRIPITRAPWCSIIPSQGTVNVSTTIVPTITVDSPIRMVDNTELTDTNVKDVLVFKKKSTGDPVSYTVTISDDKTLITLVPDSSLDKGIVYTIKISGVEDYSDNAAQDQTSDFTIQGTADTKPPFASFTPGDKATDVSVAIKPTIAFDEAIYNEDKTTITDSNVAQLITLKENNASGNNVAFTAKISSDKLAITITPSAALNYNSTYYLEIAVVSDNNGNKTTAESITFTTGGVPDALPPVAVFNPSLGTTGVPITIFPSITFDEPVYSIGGAEMTNSGARAVLSFRKGNADGEDVPFIVNVSPDKMSFLIRPQNLLLANTAYYVHLRPVEDAAGNAITKTQIVTFKTELNPDTTPPIAIFTPEDHATNVPVGVMPTITFNEQVYNIGGGIIDNAGASEILSFKKDNSSGVDVPFSVSVSPDLTSFFLRPKTMLAYNTTYYIELRALQDAIGNQTTTQSILFTTEQSDDTFAPIATFSPADGEIEVPIGILPSITFDEQVYTIGGGTMTNAAAASILRLNKGSSTGESIPFTVVVSPNKLSFLIRPLNLLEFSTTYYLELQPLQDGVGTQSVTQSILFTTEKNNDVTPPTAIFMPVDNMTDVPVGVFPSISFDEQVFTVGGGTMTNSAAASILKFKVGGASGADVPFTVTVSSGFNSFLIRPKNILATSTTYYLELGALEDSNGNQTATQSVTFTTEQSDDTAPPIAYFTPTDKMVNVPVGMLPTITFDEQVFSIGGGTMTDYVAASILRLKKDNASGVDVPFTVKVSPNLMSFIIKPSVVLSYNTTYYLELQPLQDVIGNQTVTQSITFTTEASDDNLAPIATFSPEDAQSNVSIGVLPSIIFDEQVYSLGGVPMTNVAAKSILSLKKDGAAGVDIPFTVTVSPNLLSFLIKPGVLLEFNTKYYLELRPLQDAVGSQTVTQSITFTTEQSNDTIAPTPTFVPLDKMTNVPVGVLPAVIFDEQVFSVGGATITSAGAAAVLSFKKGGSTGVDVPYTVRVSDDLRSFLIRPNMPLAYGTVYYIEVRVVEDAEGNQSAVKSITFTTEANPDNVPPVATFNPVNAETNVSIGILPSIVFDEQVYSIGGGVMTDYVATSLLRLKIGNASGADVPFTVKVSPGLNSFLVRPNNVLTYSTNYYLELLPVQDANGNQTVTQSITFTTESNDDETPPNAIFMPSDKMTNIPIGIMPTITFDEQVFGIGGATITNALAASVLKLKENNASGISIPFTVMVSPSLNSFLIRPQTALSYNTVYYLELQSVQDAVGNQTVTQSITFTTEVNPDTTAPIAIFNPENNETQVSIGVLPTISFDEQVFSIGGAEMASAGAKQALILKQNNASGANVAFTVIVTPEKRTFIIKPEQLLAYNTKYYLELRPVEDAQGNQTVAQSITFTTELNPDGNPPTPIFEPGANETNVSVGVLPSITYDEQIFSIGGAPMTNAGARSILTLKEGGASGTPVTFTVAVSPDMKSMLIRPNNVLMYNTSYYLEVKPLQDAAGNQTQVTGVTFWTEPNPDNTPPTAIFDPDNNETNVSIGIIPAITFDEQIFSLGGGEMTNAGARSIIRLKKDNASGADIPFVVTVTPDKRSFVIRPVSMLIYNTIYYLELQPLEDSNGNATATQSITFTTEVNPDSTAPIAEFYPINKQTNVPVGVMPIITFDEQIFAIGGGVVTITEAKTLVKLKVGSFSGVEVPFSINVSLNKQSMVIRPLTLLTYNTTYYLELQPVQDAVGNQTAVQGITFTTESNPDSTPPLVEFYPTNDQANVPIGVIPSITFDEQIFAIGGAVMTSAEARALISLRKGSSSGIEVPFSVRISPDMRYIIIRPLTLLEYSTAYYLELRPVQDANGNQTVTQSILFKTESNPDATPPKATFYPANADANIAVGVLPTISFDEQVYSIGGGEMTNSAAKMTVKLKVGNAAGADIPFTIQVAVDKRTFIIKPLVLLTYSQTYYLELLPVQDANGNKTSLQAITFTTVANPDTQAPTVSILPIDGATEIFVGVIPSVTFDEQVFSTSGGLLNGLTAHAVIKLKKNDATGLDVDFSVAVTPDLKAFFIRPAARLDYGTTYYLEVQPVQDAAGNKTMLQSSLFTTEKAPLLSNEANIVSGLVENQIGSTTIDNTNKTVTMVTGLSSNLSQISVQLAVSQGATIAPDPNTIKNYSSPVSYIVTSQDGLVKNTWMVTVSKESCPNHLSFISGTNILQLCNDSRGISGVEVYTSDGRRIYNNRSLNDTYTTVDMTTYSGGIYIIRLFDKNGSVIESVKVLR